MAVYAFGVPGIAVWIQHIVLGILLFYIGYVGVTTGEISTNMSLLLIISGSLGGLYHLHLWYYVHKKNQKKENQKNENE